MATAAAYGRLMLVIAMKHGRAAKRAHSNFSNKPGEL